LKPYSTRFARISRPIVCRFRDAPMTATDFGLKIASRVVARGWFLRLFCMTA